MTVAEQARQFLEWGGMPVPYSKGKKGPTAAGWTQWRFTEADLRTTFGADSNLGLLTGFGHFTDVDLDATETLTLAPQFLPRSRLVHGRASAPESHHWYLTDPALRSAMPVPTSQSCAGSPLAC